MRIHILGIGGTFMGGVALLARALGHGVTGSDAKVYPPMSTQLEAEGITLREGYDPAHLEPAPDLVIIGNALSRGNPAVEHVLDRGIPYTSGAQWVAENVLRRTGTFECRGRQDAGSGQGRWVLAVAGTHGKTTTTSMLAWILEYAHLKPGFLVGGVPENFGVSARLGDEPFFVIEADEYDTAFFDKRSKFVHYRPRTAILNNLEFDHADIFPDIAAIRRQFHHLVRSVPGSGLLVVNGADPELAETLKMGCWTPQESFGDPSGWQAELLVPDGSRFRVLFQGQEQGAVEWELIGTHNVLNALAAIAAARHAGVPVQTGCAALKEFRNVKRRMEVRGTVRGVTVYDDFAHHPTAIHTTLEALRARVGGKRIVAVLEARSNTMRMGVHRAELGPALAGADQVILCQPAEFPWDINIVTAALNGRARVFRSVDEIVTVLGQELRPDDQVLIMSNGGFDGIHAKLLARLAATSVAAGSPA
ncbi:MAG TPA: UDP-N-acetylmuramate:L-alanyl-gamma-D-glutamyl-meso-diaminopimelate ligase [Acidiferrobacterales bacterium]|nr:UDP-N-acetylmuramate:L-alanyl-gamma-D-glutamyl-meso-diaminopimelate ligase [Acidiferrobacterales bacterium]